MELNISKEINWLNHNFLSNKDTSQALYQSLEKLTLKNF